MTEPRHCQDCGRAPIISHDFPNDNSPNGPVSLTCPNCQSSTPRFDSYREALTSWNLKQISAEELYELRKRHRTELREEIREELKEEILEELYGLSAFDSPSLSSIISTVSNM